MFLKFKISCTCGCSYTISDDISTSKIICPNCGAEYPYSDKIISILNTAKEIPDGCSFNNEYSISVISALEHVNNHQ